MRISPTEEAMRFTKRWQEHGPNTYPIDLCALIDGAHKRTAPDSVKVTFGTFNSIEGCMVRSSDDPNQWHIMINSKAGSQKRQRFTLAHEIGHFNLS